MHHNITYEFTATIWQYPSTNGWVFVSLPQTMAAEIRTQIRWQEEGWGRMKAKAKVGESIWDTSIWYDTTHKTYLLPLKAAIRKKEDLVLGQTIQISLWV